MPTQTFFNLLEEKRERIIEAALKEFSMYPFNNASIARIIETAGIPRGSFYQYFTDLKDIYKYILQRIGEIKYQYINQTLDNIFEMETFTIIKQLYRAGMQFAQDYPEYAAIGNLFFKEDYNLKREIFGDQIGKSSNIFEDLLKNGQAKGEISSDIDIKVASEIFFHLNISLIDSYLAQRKGNIFEGGEAFLEIVDKMLYIVEYGVKNR